MKRCTLAFTFVLSLFVFFSAAPRAHAQSAGHWYKQGQKAEQRDDVETAYTDYQRAYQKKPSDENYKVAYERERFPAAALHVEQGEKLERLGDNTGAVTEFLRALEIDPSNELAGQDLEVIRRRVNGQSDAVAPKTSDEAFASLAGPVQLKPISDEPLTLHMVEDSKVIYQTVGKAAGINVLFDPDYTSKRIQVDLANTTLEDALRIIATVSNTFYRPITSNTIFVAANTRTKRNELDEQAVETFYLHNVTQQSDFTDVQTALRNVFQTAKLYGVASQDAIVMRGTPDELLLARKLISDLDKPKAEVVIDVAVLEVSRDLLRNIGIQLPQTASVNFQQSNANETSTTTTSTTANSSCTTGTNCGLTLNNLAHLNSTNFAVTIGEAQANLLLTDTRTKIIQDPRVRASDGQEASLKIGEKLPVATGSYQTGAATAVVSSLVNTQFQYLDVGVNVDVKPTVLYDRDVSMKVKVEVSAENGTEDLSGVDEPIITQRVAEETVRLRDGEVNILGGILQRQVTNTVSGTPGLGELPLLKYLFSTQQKEVTDDEIVFMLIPHVVRAQMIDPTNTEEIDTGTTNSIELRHVSANLPPAQSTVQTSNGVPYPSPDHLVQPGVATAPAAGSLEGAGVGALQEMQQQAMGGPPLALQLTPQQSSQHVGSTFQVAVKLAGGHDVYSVPLQMKYDSARLSLVNVDLGDERGRQMSFLGKDGQAVALVHRDDGNGNVEISASRPPGVKGVNGDGTLCVLTFQAKAPGDATVAITRPLARNSQQQPIPAVGSLAVVHVQ
jgi:general secretion pathway protein D